MDQSAGRSQLEREGEVPVDQRVRLRVRRVGPGIRGIKRRQCLLKQSEIKVGPEIGQGEKEGM